MNINRFFDSHTHTKNVRIVTVIKYLILWLSYQREMVELAFLTFLTFDYIRRSNIEIHFRHINNNQFMQYQRSTDGDNTNKTKNTYIRIILA